MKKKILNLTDLSKKIFLLKNKNKKIVLSHGSFDLIHPGHINHLKKAKSFGDILVVTITADEFVNKKLQGTYYNQDQRADFLSNLEFVDLVSIINEPSAITALKILKPDFYCKGEEYKNSDGVGNFKKEKSILKKYKIKIKLIGKQIYSSSKIISQNFNEVNNEIKNGLLKNKIQKLHLDKAFNKMLKLKILVIGEVIFDKYTNVTMMGISPKASTLSCSINYSDCMTGGALATYNFVKQFSNKVDIFSVINSSLKNLKGLNLKKNKDLIFEKNYPNLIKERIVEKDKNGNLKKILTINHFKNSQIDKSIEKKFFNKIKNKIKNYDLVILQDFGHGLITDKIAKLIERQSKKLSINVQTNSLNYGFNIMGKKILKTDMFTLDRKELELFSGKLDINSEQVLKNLSKKIKSKCGFLTCGEDYSLAYDNKNFYKIKTLDTKAVDAMGAGDIFHGMSSLMFVVEKNIFLNLLIAQISGSIAVKIEGNSDFPKKNQIQKTFDFFINSLKN